MAFVDHSILGPRPLPLKRGWAAKHTLLGSLGMLAGVAVGVGYCVWQAGHVQELLEQQAIWAAGVAAADVEVGGNMTSHLFIFDDYELDISYLTAPTGDPPSSAFHEAELEFQTLFGGPGDEPPVPAIRYLPDDPTKFALNWAVEAAPSRWGGMLFMTLAGILIAGGLLLFSFGRLRQLRDARAAVFRSSDLLLEVLHIEEQVVNGSPGGLKFTYRPLPSQGSLAPPSTQQGTVSFPPGEFPLVAHPDAGLVVGATLLALAPTHAAGGPLVLREGFHPLALPMARMAEARSKLQETAPLPPGEP